MYIYIYIYIYIHIVYVHCPQKGDPSRGIPTMKSQLSHF